MIGKRIGHYEILAKLGEGGMGEVYRARDLVLGREIALKLIRADRAADASFLERLRREARALAALDHPGIVTLFSVEEADGHSFLTMALAEGRTLDSIIPEGGMPLPEFLPLAEAILSALAAAHDKGIVHRDLKPGNVMVAGGGKLKILDFGLAKPLGVQEGRGEETPTELMTRQGDFLGTIPYMSPEQIEGKDLDPRSDLFSLGILFYEMLAGRRPFQAESTVGTLSAILRVEPESLANRRSGLSRSLVDLVHGCLAKDPGQRPDSAQQLLAALADARGREDASLYPPMDSVALSTEAARALNDQRWPEALAKLRRLEAEGAMSAADHENLAAAAFWTGHYGESIKALEAAYRLLLAADDRLGAARQAVELAETLLSMQSRIVARTWERRAQKLIAEHPDSAVAGYLMRFQVRQIIETGGDLARALDLAERVIAIAEKVGDGGLRALGIQDRGRALVLDGRPELGLADIDEAMASAVSGELPPDIRGVTFCNMMSVCETLADYERASEWCAAGGEWSAQHGASPYPGICRVHRAELLRLHGDWPEAERQARQTAREFSRDLPGVAGEAHYMIGEIQLRRGEHAEAEASFQEAHRLGKTPLPGLALLRLRQGQASAAAGLMDRYLAELESSPFQQAKLWPARLKIAVAMGDLPAARRAVEKLEGFAGAAKTTALRAHAAGARGALHLAEGRAQAAIADLRQACRLSLEIDLSYETACHRALLAEAFAAAGHAEDALLEYRAAAGGFEQLGAAFDLGIVRDRIAALPR